MGNDRIIKKFDDIDEKIDFMIEFCQTLQSENRELTLRIRSLETELDKENQTGKEFSNQEALIQNKMDGLLEKLDFFSNTTPGDHQTGI